MDQKVNRVPGRPLTHEERVFRAEQYLGACPEDSCWGLRYRGPLFDDEGTGIGEYVRCSGPCNNHETY